MNGMNGMSERTRPHWSFWVISVLTLVWNAMGCMNFIMQMDPEALTEYPEAARSLVASRPTGATSAFAIAVFGGALGCVLLVLRKALALPVFVVSLIGVVVTNVHTFSHGASPEIWTGSLSSLILAAFLVWYAALARRRGWTG